MGRCTRCVSAFEFVHRNTETNARGGALKEERTVGSGGSRGVGSQIPRNIEGLSSPGTNGGKKGGPGCKTCVISSDFLRNSQQEKGAYGNWVGPNCCWTVMWGTLSPLC